VVFRSELNDLTNKLNFRVVYEYGRIDGEMLEKHLPESRASYQYFICGPAVMMSAVEGFLNQTGIPASRIHSERFDIA
jgi:ferredoxin-NADP reductase